MKPPEHLFPLIDNCCKIKVIVTSEDVEVVHTYNEKTTDLIKVFRNNTPDDEVLEDVTHFLAGISSVSTLDAAMIRLSIKELLTQVNEDVQGD